MMPKRTFASLIIFLALCTLYATLWFFMATQIKAQFPILTQNAAANGIEIEGAWSNVSGFPLKHRITFSGDIIAPYGTIHLSDTTIKGFFLPSQIVEISASHGGYFTPHPTSPLERGEDLMTVESFTLQAVIPSPLPRAFTQSAMTQWQKSDGKLVFPLIHIQSNGVTAQGQGSVILDENLQPDANLTLNVTGHQQFIGKLQEHGIIKGKDAMIAGVVLTGLSKPDPQTQEPVLNVTLTLKNQTLSAAGFPLARLPAVTWQRSSSDNPPAPHR